MAGELPKEMRIPRACTPTCGTEDGWFYVNPKSIDVHASSTRGGGQSVRLYRKQLERALAIMDKYKED